MLPGCPPPVAWSRGDRDGLLQKAHRKNIPGIPSRPPLPVLKSPPHRESPHVIPQEERVAATGGGGSPQRRHRNQRASEEPRVRSVPGRQDPQVQTKTKSRRTSSRTTNYRATSGSSLAGEPAAAEGERETRRPRDLPSPRAPTVPLAPRTCREEPYLPRRRKRRRPSSPAGHLPSPPRAPLRRPEAGFQSKRFPARGLVDAGLTSLWCTLRITTLRRA